jgi:hypothetical protein
MPKAPTAEEVLAEFVRDIDDTGGIRPNREGLWYPVADEDWIDLAETYRKACQVLGRKPKTESSVAEEIEIIIRADVQS